MSAPFDSHDWEDRKMQEWLLLLLRFAITRAPSDRAAAHSMALALDSPGAPWQPTQPRFFVRTSHEVCDAILAAGDRRDAILLRHIARIDHPRLRRAFRAAVGFQQSSKASPSPAIDDKDKDDDLRNGPPKK